LEKLDLTNFYSYYDIQDFFSNYSKIEIINGTILSNNDTEIINDLDHIINRTTLSKNEIVNNLDDIVKDKDLKKTYIIEGEDYFVYIKPINKYIESSSVNINFSVCEKILKKNYPNKNFTVTQINMKNNNKKYIVDQVQYKIYDNEKNPIELSLCKNKKIKIEYKVVDKSEINIEKARYFKEKSVYIFNINDSFFNDICYPFSNSKSDIILKDRIEDIYQNYSICDNNCKYDNINLELNSVACTCQIKTEINTEIDPPAFESIISDIFLSSNFGVLKCYKLIFSSKYKLNNIGFWIFLVFVIAHIPLYIIYFIFGIKSIIIFNNENIIKIFDVIKTIKNEKENNIINNKINNNIINDNININNKIDTKNIDINICPI
jgi:hypothetical protein